jgi:hypothetical protein
MIYGVHTRSAEANDHVLSFEPGFFLLDIFLPPCPVIIPSLIFRVILRFLHFHESESCRCTDLAVARGLNYRTCKSLEPPDIAHELLTPFAQLTKGSTSAFVGCRRFYSNTQVTIASTQICRAESESEVVLLCFIRFMTPLPSGSFKFPVSTRVPHVLTN